jgi:hypothetical protein
VIRAQFRCTFPLSYRDVYPETDETRSDVEKEASADFSLPRSRQQEYNSDPDQVFKAIKDYKAWTSNASTCTYENLPNFDDLKAYGLQEDEVDKLLRKEINKYTQFADSPEPNLFNSHGGFDKANADGFANLSAVMDQIQCNLTVIMHDNACLAMESCPNANFYEEHFRPSRKILRERYGREPSSVTGRKPKLMSDPDENQKVYHAMVDVIFGSIAWWLKRVAQNNAMDAQITAVLALWAVKLKIIALDPYHCAELSLTRGVDIMRQLSNSGRDDDNRIVVYLTKDGEDKPKLIDFSNDHLNLAIDYYQLKLGQRRALEGIIAGITQNMVVRKPGSKSLASFEVRTLIYGGTPDENPREIFVSRDGEVAINSHIPSINHNYVALQLAIANAERFHRDRDNTPNIGVMKPDAVVMSWSRAGNDGKPLELITDQLDHLISVLVPLGLRSNHFLLLYLSSFLSNDANDEEETGMFETRSNIDITTEFRLNTQAYLETQRMNSSLSDPDIILTSDIPLWRSSHSKF